MRYSFASRQSWTPNELVGTTAGFVESGVSIGALLSVGDDSSDLAGDPPCQDRGNGVSDLRLDTAPSANEVVVVREGEEPFELADAKPPVLPVERSDVGARLRLDRR